MVGHGAVQAGMGHGKRGGLSEPEQIETHSSRDVEPVLAVSASMF